MYLIDEIKKLLGNPELFEWVDGHVVRGSPPATYEIIEKLGTKNVTAEKLKREILKGFKGAYGEYSFTSSGELANPRGYLTKVELK